MVEWHQDGLAVTVTCARSDDAAVWTHLQRCMYGHDAHDSSTDTTLSRRLSLVEAYYAIAVEEVLPLSTCSALDLWTKFSTVSSSFEAQYVVFHHFRQLDWYLRSGLNYGAHYVLYRGDADTHHSEYIVYIHTARDRVPWHTVQALTRIAEDVKKTVLLCEVHQVDDEGESEGDVRSMTHGRYCINNRVFTVDAVMIRCWAIGDVDGEKSDFSFVPQPLILKKIRKSKSSRPKKDKHKDTTSSSTA